MLLTLVVVLLSAPGTRLESTAFGLGTAVDERDTGGNTALILAASSGRGSHYGTRMNSPLHASRIHSLRDAIGDRKVVAFNAGPDGEVYVVLALEPTDYHTEDNGFATYPKTIPRTPQRYRVLSLRSGALDLDLVIEHEPFNIHEVQPIDGDLLLVCVRAAVRGPDDFDLNGRVYSRDGAFLRGHHLGDAIETVQVSSRGEIWTSFFDEGTYGPNAGESGLVAWNKSGAKVFEFESPEPGRYITDCYALNVASDDDTWCYYYQDFPLVHIREKRIASTWDVPVAGSHAFAVANGHALFAGTYDEHDTLTLVSLESDGAATEIGTFELIGSAGGVVKLERTVGRGESLYVLSDKTVYEIALTEVLAARAG